MIRSAFHIFYLILLLSAAGCCTGEDTPEVTGMQPIYISYDELLEYAQLPPQEIVNAGKIMVYGNHLFLGEVNKGIHVIDISDTLNPVKRSFLKVPGNKDIVAQSDRLYVDNGPHLLVLNIENINQITLVQRNLNFFQATEYFPSNFTGVFECADYSKGWVIDWGSRRIRDPKCNR